MSTLTEFLLARIADDEQAGCIGEGEYATCADLSDRREVEAKAKRRIVEQYAFLAKNGDTGDARWVLPLLAVPYSAHPDFQQEWAVRE